MDSLKDFYKEAKNRIGNPLFFSFIVAWLLINWRIPIAFIMYDNKSIVKHGYNSYFELICAQHNETKFLYNPLCYALIYTFAFPPIRLIIIAFLTLFKKWSNNLNLVINKDANVPMLRFIQETERSDSLGKKLEDLYKKDSIIKVQNETLLKDKNDLEVILSNEKISHGDLQSKHLDLQTELTTAKSSISSYERTINECKRSGDLNLISGLWDMTIMLNSENLLNLRESGRGAAYQNIYKVNIDGDEIYIEREQTFFFYAKIKLFFVDYFSGSINLVLNINDATKYNNATQTNYISIQKMSLTYSVNNEIHLMNGENSEGNKIIYKRATIKS